MGERILTKEELDSRIRKLQAELLIFATFGGVMERGDFVMVDESKKEPTYRIVKSKDKH